MKLVCQKTGLTSHAIRIWEKRYGAVTPERTASDRRLYSDHDIERLSLLRELTHSGHNISTIANLPTEKLRSMAEKSATAIARNDSVRNSPALLDQAVNAVARLDAAQLENILNQGAVELGTQGLLQKVIAPLAQMVGELWREGTITAAHEHFASAVIRIFLGHAAKSFVASEAGPVLVVATPNGQLHELGALLVGAAAANLGWRVTYLGASLPAAEIAGAVIQSRARALALSIVYPEDDPRIEPELKRLRELLPAGTVVLIGGRAAPAYRKVLENIDALEMKDLSHLCTTLDQLRKPHRNRK